MGYQMELESCLLPGWEEWDNGHSLLPGKNITLLDGTQGCIIISSETTSVYNKPLDIVNDVDEDMGLNFVDGRQTVEQLDELSDTLSPTDIEECKIVFTKYLEREASWVDERKASVDLDK